MANTKSTKKRVCQNEVRRMRNVSKRSDIKTSCKKVSDALTQGNADIAKSELKIVESKIARASGKGLIKKNTASRKISKLAKKVASLTKKVSK